VRLSCEGELNMASCVSVGGEAIGKGRDIRVVKIKEASRAAVLTLCVLYVFCTDDSSTKVDMKDSYDADASTL
jgi:hypothetical protein